MYGTVGDITLLVLSAAAATPVAVLAAEVAGSLAALPKLRRGSASPQGRTSRPRIAIVIPAHNEQVVLGATLAAVRAQLGPDDRLVVVADNCADATASVAREAGAICVERNEPGLRGKGYAMAAGLRRLEDNPPDVVIFNDADVIPAEGAIEALAAQALSTGRPAQGEYLLHSPANADGQAAVSRFAFVFRNRVRALGLWRLGGPVPLHGSGMAFPWGIIRDMPLGSAELAEDMRLGLDLADRGQAPQFCPEARFDGELPGDRRDAAGQRRRWEHGHFNVLRSVPGRLVRGIARRRGGAVAMALDHLVPPVTTLAVLLLALAAGTLAWWVWRGTGTAAAAFLVAVIALLMLTLSVLVAWAAHLRGEVSLKVLLSAPGYFAQRMVNQSSWLFSRQRDWVRTPRPGDTESVRTAPTTPHAPGIRPAISGAHTSPDGSPTASAAAATPAPPAAEGTIADNPPAPLPPERTRQPLEASER